MTESEFSGAIAPPDLLLVIETYWQDALCRLRPDDLLQFGRVFNGLREAVNQERLSVFARADDLMSLLRHRLPAGHPVRRAIAAQHHASASQPDLASMAAHIAGLELPELVAAAVAAVELDETYDRLLAEPAFTETEVLAAGVVPDRDDLIRLPVTSRHGLLPKFQFHPDGQPVQVVTEVNWLLDVAEDPWGVADWWLGENAWLGGIPARLLGQVDNNALLRAAKAVLPESENAAFAVDVGGVPRPGPAPAASAEPGEE
jgi:hypothetical protein